MPITHWFAWRCREPLRSGVDFGPKAWYYGGVAAASLTVALIEAVAYVEEGCERGTAGHYTGNGPGKWPAAVSYVAHSENAVTARPVPRTAWGLVPRTAWGLVASVHTEKPDVEGSSGY